MEGAAPAEGGWQNGALINIVNRDDNGEEVHAGNSRGKETGPKQQEEQRQIHDGIARQKWRSENKQGSANGKHQRPTKGRLKSPQVTGAAESKK